MFKIVFWPIYLTLDIIELAQAARATARSANDLIEAMETEAFWEEYR